jgi:hypothetical protein
MIFTLDVGEKEVEVLGVKFLIGYPTVQQKYELEKVISSGVDFSIKEILTNKKLKGIKDKSPEELYSDIYSILTFEQRSKIEAAENMYRLLYLKYTIKEWEGLKDSQGNETKCVVENNELADYLLDAISSTENVVNLLYDAIKEKLRWNDTDKKKFISTDGSNSKAVSEVKP